MEWMLMPYRRYADFSGRSRRKEYWLFVLFQILVSLVIATVLGRPSYERVGIFFGFSSALSGPGGVVQNLFGLFSLIPGLAVAVRRLHDQDRSGWLLLLVLIPLFGWFALMVLMCLNGTRGANRFGSDPKNPTDTDAFS